ncbi:MAG: hypothetical protein HYT87_11955 [Nitrospirae bacterium]|nr:hypothetical protein [Nitrospirota bacterium]
MRNHAVTVSNSARVRVYPVRSTKQLEELLVRTRLNFFKGKDEFLLPFDDGKGAVIQVFVRYAKKTNAVYCYTRDLDRLRSDEDRGNPNLLKQYRWLLHKNYNAVTGTYGRKDADGEVVAKSTLPLDGGGISTRQMKRHLLAVVARAVTYLREKTSGKWNPLPS